MPLQKPTERIGGQDTGKYARLSYRCKSSRHWLFDEAKHPYLVVDDSNVIAHLIERMLPQCGFVHITRVSSGEAALNSVRAGRCKIVIGDIVMPGVNGIELLRAIRRDPLGHDICVVLMTAANHPELESAAVRYQVDCLIRKPFTKEVLRQKLTEIPKLLEPANGI